MPSFLQSEPWQRFQAAAGVANQRHNSLLYLLRSFGFGTYWQSSRFTTQSFEIPPFSSGSRFLRLEPEDEPTLEAIRRAASEKNLPLRPTVALQPRQTLLLNIERPIEEIVAGFKQKHRYNYNVSQRSLLESEVRSKQVFDEAFERFWKLMQETANRQDFRTHHKGYYQEMLRFLEDEGMAHIVIVRRDQEDLAAMILITHDGTATYLHGASSQSHREAMAPYFLHVAAIKFAQSLGMKTYDFWGTDAVQVNGEWKPKDGAASAGTTRFKLGFGGDIVQYPGCFDLVLQPFWYTLYTVARRLRGGKRAFS